MKSVPIHTHIVLLLVLLVQINIFVVNADTNTDDINIDSTSASASYIITVDYIVVGGGAAGAVAASRLSENSSISVLLIDGGARSQSSVGGTDYVASRYHFSSSGQAVFDTPYTRYDVPTYTYTAPSDYPGSPTPPYPLQTSYAGTLDTHSRILGGNSVHNYMVWDRMTPYSLSTWNVTGWTFTDCLPYYKKSENATNLHLSNAAYRGTSGPIVVNYAQAPDPAGDAFIKSCVTAGFGQVTDFNDPNNHVGCGQPQFNINNQGVRASAVNQYLAPALSRQNLKIRLNARVTKVLFTTPTAGGLPRAKGVQYTRNGVTYTAYANHEIILSAGAFNTPKILLLSGIGPAAHLNSLGIPVVANLPVGQRMALHPVLFAEYKYNVTSHNPYDISGAATEYALKGTGIFASTGVPAEAKLKSKPSVPDFDINVLIALGGYDTVGVIEFAALIWGSKQNNGTITLTSTNPEDPPYFDYTPYQNLDDRYAMVQTLRYFRQIAKASPDSSILGPETLPGPSYSDSTADLERYLFQDGGSFPTITHLHGGAVLGNDDQDSVLNPHMSVKKVTGLRVADASIVPGLILAGPNSNCIMFGERVAAFIQAGQM